MKEISRHDITNDVNALRKQVVQVCTCVLHGDCKWTMDVRGISTLFCGASVDLPELTKRLEEIEEDYRQHAQEEFMEAVAREKGRDL